MAILETASSGAIGERQERRISWAPRSVRAFYKERASTRYSFCISANAPRLTGCGALVLAAEAAWAGRKILPHLAAIRPGHHAHLRRSTSCAMQMNQIRYFVAVCETQNFTRAAQKCNVTQPALTRGIRTLEAELGGFLFRRERGATHLTDLGRLMRPLLETIQQQS